MESRRHSFLWFRGHTLIAPVEGGESTTFLSLVSRTHAYSSSGSRGTPSACYRFRLDCSYSLVPASAGASPPPPPPPFFFFSPVPDRGTGGICARDRRALQQLALNVTWRNLESRRHSFLWFRGHTLIIAPMEVAVRRESTPVVCILAISIKH